MSSHPDVSGLVRAVGPCASKAQASRLAPPCQHALFKDTHGRASHEAQRRNVLSGIVKDIKKGAVAAQVIIDIGGGNTITSTIPVDSVQDLGLEVGKPVTATSEVILSVED